MFFVLGIGPLFLSPLSEVCLRLLLLDICVTDMIFLSSMAEETSTSFRTRSFSFGLSRARWLRILRP